jgi:hypothetical protein
MTTLSARRVMVGIALLYPFWLAMMAVHELGHVAAALVTGGKIVRVVVPLMGFSRTDVDPNPSPHIVTWAGPIVGAALPLALLLIPVDSRVGTVGRAFAGWCLIANGAYIGVGWIDRVGDAGELMRFGTSQSFMIAYGVACAASGIYLWHSLGKAQQNTG